MAVMVISCVVLAVAIGMISGNIVDQGMPEWCLRCLCEATSGGPNCVFGGACHDGVCGPYAITLPYWQDSGRPTVGLEDRQSTKAYEKCALDSTCSQDTIKGYMTKFHQDCNGDGVEDCQDYVFIHFHGGYGCNKPLSVPAQNVFSSCMSRIGNPVPPPPAPTPSPASEVPDKPDYYPFSETGDNDVLFPAKDTTYPSIDIRFGD